MSLGWKVEGEADFNIGLPTLNEQEEQFLYDFTVFVRKNKIEENELEQAIDQFAELNDVFLEHDQKLYLLEYAKHHIFGYAFIDYLLDLDCEEITVPSINKNSYIFVGSWKKVNAFFTDEKFFMEIINRLAKQTGRRITYSTPRIDAVLPDGSRLHATIQPISKGELTIRKFSRKRITLKDLTNIYSADFLTLFSFLFQSDSNVVVAGNTASGKTTLLNTLFSFVPFNERIIIIEQTPEIDIPHEHKIRLVASKEHNISLKDLVYDSLRMRPDRLIVGEIRSREETQAFFDAMFAGQGRGTYATFHALSGEEFNKRIVAYGIDKLDINSITAVIIQRRHLVYSKKHRKNIEKRSLKEIYLPFMNKSFNKKDRIFEKFLFYLGDLISLSKKETMQEFLERKKYILKNDFQRRFYGIKVNKDK